MNEKKIAGKGTGYQEVTHTADWALRVWAPDLNALLLVASEGMYALSEIKYSDLPGNTVIFSVRGIDAESLLVEFLSELVYLADVENLGVESMTLERTGFSLEVRGVGKQIRHRKKEIKAVTYHNLKIVKTEMGYETVIVFDV